MPPRPQKIKGNVKMERNQNGYPIAHGDNTRGGTGCTGNEHMEQGRSIDDMPIGYAYVPMQKFRMLFSAENALPHGTLFEELYLPPEVYAK